MTVQKFYDQLGGAERLSALVESFYSYMDRLPEAATIRAMHAPDLSDAKQKLFEFLSGWTGGPQLYQEKYGHPRLRARHLPFAINSAARDQWMLCMRKALADNVQDRALQKKLEENFLHLADFMRNTEDYSSSRK